jgi:hypothetical protein
MKIILYLNDFLVMDNIKIVSKQNSINLVREYEFINLEKGIQKTVEWFIYNFR